MNKKDMEQILSLLEGISLAEWQKLKVCIDRGFNFQSNKLKLEINSALLADLSIDLIQ